MYSGISHAEQNAARVLVALLLRDGCTVSVYDGEEWPLKCSADAAAILDAMGSTEADTLRWRDASGASLGYFYLVWGNSAAELVADLAALVPCETVWDEWSRLVEDGANAAAFVLGFDEAASDVTAHYVGAHLEAYDKGRNIARTLRGLDGAQ